MSRSFRSYLLISFGCCFSFVPLMAKADSQRFFYCETSNNFYPYVQTCSVPWKELDKAALAQQAVMSSAPAPAPAPTQMASAAPLAEAPHHVVAYPIGMPPPTQSPAPAPAVAPAPVLLTPAVATMAAPASEMATSHGPTVFIYGADTPIIVCAVSQLCDMALQPGEKINHIILGDPDHWKVETLEEGSGGAETLHLIIRPASSDLATSMIVLTKSRSYHVQLQSHRKDYMMQVAFTYPEAQAPVGPPSAAMAPADQPEAAVDTDDGFVKVGDITYVKGREPRALGSNKPAEPPLPAAVPRPEVSTTTTP